MVAEIWTYGIVDQLVALKHNGMKHIDTKLTDSDCILTPFKPLTETPPNGALISTPSGADTSNCLVGDSNLKHRNDSDVVKYITERPKRHNF